MGHLPELLQGTHRFIYLFICLFVYLLAYLRTYLHNSYSILPIILFSSFSVNSINGSLFFLQIYDTTVTREDNAVLQDAFESSVIFLLLSKFDNHQVRVCMCAYVCVCVCECMYVLHLMIALRHTTDSILKTCFSFSSFFNFLHIY